MYEKHFHVPFCLEYLCFALWIYLCFALWTYEFGDLLIYLACLFVCSRDICRRVRSIGYG